MPAGRCECGMRLCMDALARLVRVRRTSLSSLHAPLCTHHLTRVRASLAPCLVPLRLHMAADSIFLDQSQRKLQTGKVAASPRNPSFRAHRIAACVRKCSSLGAIRPATQNARGHGHKTRASFAHRTHTV
jgi:hypothetical protein